MKIAQINQVSGYGSTGKIVEDLSNLMTSADIENVILYGMYDTNHAASRRFGSEASHRFHKLMARGLGLHGHGSVHSTKEMVAFLQDFQPDVIHLHNLHGFYLNLEILFDYLHRSQIPVVWTLHDCWNFTGHCAYFSYAGCNRWETGCGHCPQKMAYPKSLLDRSAKSLQEKRKLFTGLKQCTIVTPSRWLADLVNQSFLNCYPVKVIPNGIDLAAFSPSPKNTNRPKIVLANVRSLQKDDHKGGGYLTGLAQALGTGYEIQVLGLNQTENLPAGIRALPYIRDRKELAEVYSKADVFVNPTLEDNFPTVNLEALACGTPVVTFSVGGSPESLTPACGAVVPLGDTASLAAAVRHWANTTCVEACRSRAEQFEKDTQFQQYIDLYRVIAM